MIDISTALSNILKAVYGKQVRESIHDAIYQINQNANEAVDLAQIRFGADVTYPTSSVEGYTEGVIYFNVLTGIIWKLSGGSWDPLGSMKSIKEIRKTATQGNVDTYTIYYNDETTGGFVVRNGEQGVSVVNITKTDSAAGVDYYEVNLSDGSTTPNGFAVTNGKDGVSVSNITLESTVGDTKNYSVNLSDGTKTPNGFSVKDGTSNYVYIRYSASFDGQGMVTVPTDNTVYIGICVSTQSTAPTDPAVYSWVRFIGKSGTGSGDMLSSDFVTIYKNTFVVDNAAALFDGQKQILANELLNKTDYASNGLAGTVDKATQLVDKENSKVADTKVLANFTDDGTGLKYKGEKVGGEVAVDEETITTNEDGELTLSSEVSEKISKVDNLTESVNKNKKYNQYLVAEMFENGSWYGADISWATNYVRVKKAYILKKGTWDYELDNNWFLVPASTYNVDLKIEISGKGTIELAEDYVFYINEEGKTLADIPNILINNKFYMQNALGVVTKEITSNSLLISEIAGCSEYADSVQYGTSDGYEHACIYNNKIYIATQAQFQNIKPTVTSGWDTYWKESNITELGFGFIAYDGGYLNISARMPSGGSCGLQCTPSDLTYYVNGTAMWHK